MKTIKKYNEFGELFCECCGDQIISDAPEIMEHELCDRCYDEINGDEIIGYGRGE